MRGSVLPIKNNLEETILNFIKEAFDKKCIEAVILPKRVPSGDSFAYLLIKDKSILEGTSPFPPVIPVQGAKAISSLTRQGNVKKKILAIMHPCEIRATIELFKLKQTTLNNLIFMSYDCSGVLPLSSYLENPDENDQIFLAAQKKWDSKEMRPVCKICTEFSIPASDLNIGQLGTDEGKVFLIPNNSTGEELLNAFSLNSDVPLDGWETEVEKLRKERENVKKEAHQELKTKVKGPENLLETFSNCINCHNCMRVCPVCYCRQCYFDSDAFKFTPDSFISKAKKKGSIRLPSDTLIFHLGRMSHMIHSCVSCGTCEDACPMDIPIAQIFNLVADKTQQVLDYKPGRNIEEPLPTVTYQEEELQEFEKPYSETYIKVEETNV
ncbi:MAG: 4Fe-4S dicluster domain-containing protein [Ignavibacteria bacterium]|nr:4Fe-4S dicluster domain-containing protein [Ignavibacteria bacterium]